MKKPPYLAKGDTVGILSTARKISRQQLEPFLELLKSWNLNYSLGKTIGAEENQFAGGDDLRRQDLQHMLDDPNINAIWCAKGGYGTVRLLDDLDFTKFLEHPKWIIGYSDITALHSHLHNLGIETIHGQIGENIEKKSDAARSSLKNILFGNNHSILFSEEVHEKNRLGVATGPLVGGNLSLLYSLCGSPSALNTDGKILFIEDLDEYLYHVDRMMMNLKRNGMLENLRGLIVGGMTKMHDNNQPFGKAAEEIILDSVSGYDYPVCFNFPAGHIDDNRALILGREVELSVQTTEIALHF
ncbi:MAG: LD-carboxypeptidase [Flavobacteriaceae bacterium]|nr:LD-carboxypeptidase [Flavobacteriaceae bacterium]